MYNNALMAYQDKDYSATFVVFSYLICIEGR